MTLVNIVLANGLILAERDLSFLILLLGVLDANGVGSAANPPCIIIMEEFTSVQ